MSLRQYYVATNDYDAKLMTLVELLMALQVHQKFGIAVCCGSRDALDEVVGALLSCRLFDVFALHSDMTEAERNHQLESVKRRAAAASSSSSSPSVAVSSNAASAAAASVAPSFGHAGSTTTLSATSPPTGPGGSAQAQAAAGVVARASGGGGGGYALGSGATAGEDGSGAAGAGGAAARPPPAAGLQRACVLATTDVVLKAAPRELLPLGLPLLVQYDLPAKKETYQRRIACMFGGGKERRRNQRSVVIDFVVAGEVGAFRAIEQFGTGGPIQEMPVQVSDIFA